MMAAIAGGKPVIFLSHSFITSAWMTPIPTRSMAAYRITAAGSANREYPGGITNAQWKTFSTVMAFTPLSIPLILTTSMPEYQGGFAGRVNRHTLEGRLIQPKANYKEKLRFNWNTPIVASPNEKGTIYIGAQFLFRSRDHGQSWERISPDLTTNDPEKQKQEQSGGVTVDNSAAEMHTTIFRSASRQRTET